MTPVMSSAPVTDTATTDHTTPITRATTEHVRGDAPRHSHSTTARDEIDSLATTIVRSGVAAVDPIALALLARQARSAGASAVLVDVLLGAHEPTVARERAFGRIASHLLRSRPSAGVPQQR